MAKAEFKDEPKLNNDIIITFMLTAIERQQKILSEQDASIVLLKDELNALKKAVAKMNGDSLESTDKENK